MRWVWLFGISLLLIAGVRLSAGQGGGLDPGAAVRAERQGKQVVFTPVVGMKKLSGSAFGKGPRLLGELNTQFAGKSVRLPPGRYQVYLARTGKTFQVTFRAGGKVVAQVDNVAGRPPGPDHNLGLGAGIEICDGHCLCACIDLPFIGKECVHIYCW